MPSNSSNSIKVKDNLDRSKANQNQKKLANVISKSFKLDNHLYKGFKYKTSLKIKVLSKINSPVWHGWVACMTQVKCQKLLYLCYRN